MSRGQPPRHVLVGGLHLAVGGAGVCELVARVGVLQVAPHARHVGGDVVVTVLLGHDLRGERERGERGARERGARERERREREGERERREREGERSERERGERERRREREMGERG